jgi:hypothetical protein
VEWDALQPQRVRFVEPLILLSFCKPATVRIVARVYAESFASPLTLKAQIGARVETCRPDTDALLERAKGLQRAEATRTTLVGSLGDMWSGSFRHTDEAAAAEQGDAAGPPAAEG